ncbi:MAG TPA: hypothetical protein VLI04_00025 [Nocardioidaceae bacterium]|nr:hypothetical protein [Nocardioidaceae bacterium]
MRRPKLALVATAALFALTGCAGLRPGVAAEVGDQQITLEQLDDFAATFCKYLSVGQPGQKSSKLVRQGALVTMVQARLGHLYGEEDPTTIDRASVEDALAGVKAAIADLPEGDQEAFLEEVSYFLEGSQYLAQVGDQAAQEELLSTLVDEYGVELDPRFGSWDEIRSEDAPSVSGSLSVPLEATEFDPNDQTAGLSASQTCGG